MDGTGDVMTNNIFLLAFVIRRNNQPICMPLTSQCPRGLPLTSSIFLWLFFSHRIVDQNWMEWTTHAQLTEPGLSVVARVSWAFHSNSFTVYDFSYIFIVAQSAMSAALLSAVLFPVLFTFSRIQLIKTKFNWISPTKRICQLFLWRCWWRRRQWCDDWRLTTTLKVTANRWWQRFTQFKLVKIPLERNARKHVHSYTVTHTHTQSQHTRHTPTPSLCYIITNSTTQL